MALSAGIAAQTLEIPRRLRAMVRARVLSLIALAALVGALGGLVVTVMGTGVDRLHELLFQLEPGVRLSAQLRLDPVLAVAVPLIGGLRPDERFLLQTVAAGPGNRSDRSKCTARGPDRSSAVFSSPRKRSGQAASARGSASKQYAQLASGIASRIGGALHLRRGNLASRVGTALPRMPGPLERRSPARFTASN